MDEVRTVGIVLHPHRDSAEAVNTILTWAATRGVTVLGLDQEIGRLDGVAVIVSAGGDGRPSGPSRSAGW